MAVDPAHITYELLDSGLIAQHAPDVVGAALKQISELFDQGLGEGYYSVEELHNLFECGGAVIAAYDTVFEHYVGAVTVFEMSCGLADLEMASWEDPIFPQCVGMNVDAKSGIAELESATVSAGARGHGIGSKLYRMRLLWAWQQPNVHSAVAYSWRSGVNESYGLHMRLGGVEGTTQSGMFIGMPCTTCGASCECDATLIVFHKPTTDIDGDLLT